MSQIGEFLWSTNSILNIGALEQHFLFREGFLASARWEGVLCQFVFPRVWEWLESQMTLKEKLHCES